MNTQEGQTVQSNVLASPTIGSPWVKPVVAEADEVFSGVSSIKDVTLQVTVEQDVNFESGFFGVPDQSTAGKSGCLARCFCGRHWKQCCDTMHTLAFALARPLAVLTVVITFGAVVVTVAYAASTPSSEWCIAGPWSGYADTVIFPQEEAAKYVILYLLVMVILAAPVALMLVRAPTKLLVRVAYFGFANWLMVVDYYHGSVATCFDPGRKDKAVGIAQDIIAGVLMKNFVTHCVNVGNALLALERLRSLEVSMSQPLGHLSCIRLCIFMIVVVRFISH